VADERGNEKLDLEMCVDMATAPPTLSVCNVSRQIRIDTPICDLSEPALVPDMLYPCISFSVGECTLRPLKSVPAWVGSLVPTEVLRQPNTNDG